MTEKVDERIKFETEKHVKPHFMIVILIETFLSRGNN